MATASKSVYCVYSVVDALLAGSVLGKGLDEPQRAQRTQREEGSGWSSFGLSAFFAIEDDVPRVSEAEFVAVVVQISRRLHLNPHGNRTRRQFGFQSPSASDRIKIRRVLPACAGEVSGEREEWMRRRGDFGLPDGGRRS